MLEYMNSADGLQGVAMTALRSQTHLIHETLKSAIIVIDNASRLITRLADDNELNSVRNAILEETNETLEQAAK